MMADDIAPDPGSSDEGGPGLAFKNYSTMEELLEKLKLLNYDQVLFLI